MDPYIQILITVCSLGGMLYGMLKFMLRDIHKDLSDLKEGMRRTEARTDHLYEENNRLYRTLNEETNRLYKTLIEIVRK